MRQQILEAVMFSVITLVTLIWIEVVPVSLLTQVAVGLLAWALLSTLLVGSAAAWVALGRSRARARRRISHLR